MSNAKRVAVVGAGPGGLTAAMILAHRGFQVEVYEARDRVGGRNAELKVGDYTFDTGPTFLMMKFILDEVFREAGANGDELLDFKLLDPMYRLQFKDACLEPSPDNAKTRAAMEESFPGKGQAFDRFLKQERARFESMAPCLQRAYGSFSSLFCGDLLKALPRIGIGRTVFGILNGYFQDERLALAFSFQSKYLGMSPWTCPGAFAMLSYIEHGYGIYHTTGGLSEISRAMADTARKNGASIHLGRPVKSVLLDGREARGLELADGEKVDADKVVVNADFGHGMCELFPSGSLRKWAPEALEKKRFSCSIFMIYLGVDKVYDLPHHTVFFAHDYRSNVREIFESKDLSTDNSFYIRNASATDPTLAPEGHSGLYVLVPVPNLRSGTSWEAEKERFKEHILDLMQERAGLADLRRHIKAEAVITPADWRDDYFVYHGAVFNLAHNIGQMLCFRPHNRFEEVGNCYLVGGGTHPGSGLPTIYESGRIAANLLCRDTGTPFTSGNLKV
jgi:phytoene desaturase